jgi:hypothetical protein
MRNRNIKIAVSPRLNAKQRINAPTAIDHDINAV